MARSIFLKLGELREVALQSIETSEGKNNTTPDDGTESTHKFVSSFVVNLGVAVVVLGLFSFLRPRLKQIYSPRQLLLDVMFPLGKLPNSFFAWIIPAFMASDDDVFYYTGIDALVYMRFLRLCVKISLVIMPYGIAVLLPLNYFGRGALHGLDRIAMSNIAPQSSKFWAHVISAWVYTVIICYLLYEEWRVYIIYRQEYLSYGRGHQYAVLIRDIPVKVGKSSSSPPTPPPPHPCFPPQLSPPTVLSSGRIVYPKNWHYPFVKGGSCSFREKILFWRREEIKMKV